MGFVRNLILNNSCEFYYDDVTVTSFVNDKYGDGTTLVNILYMMSITVRFIDVVWMGKVSVSDKILIENPRKEKRLGMKTLLFMSIE